MHSPKKKKKRRALDQKHELKNDHLLVDLVESMPSSRLKLVIQLFRQIFVTIVHNQLPPLEVNVTLGSPDHVKMVILLELWFKITIFHSVHLIGKPILIVNTNFKQFSVVLQNNKLIQFNQRCKTKSTRSVLFTCSLEYSDTVLRTESCGNVITIHKRTYRKTTMRNMHFVI